MRTRRPGVSGLEEMIAATFEPVAVGMSGWLYGIAVALLGVEIRRRAWRLWKEEGTNTASPLFFFSIMYLFSIFVLLLADKALQTLI